jgi:hypothetical protein
MTSNTSSKSDGRTTYGPANPLRRI